MIQKIKLLQTEMAQAILSAEMGEPHLQQVRQMKRKKEEFLVCRKKSSNRYTKLLTNDNLTFIDTNKWHHT
jgi:hypothetical protein